MFRRAATDAVSGVLGISKWGNWPYMTGSWTFEFVQTRHGAANNRAARLRAYSQVRQWLALDSALDPGLRADLMQRLEVLGVNPLEDSVFDQAEIAQRQYAALLRYAEDPNGLPARIAQDRMSELTAYEHGLPARTGFRLARLATFGLYTHRERDDGLLEARLDRERRVARQLEFLDNVARSGPQAEVVWNMDEVRHALDVIASGPVPARSAQLVQRILQQTDDEETRSLAHRALHSLDGAGAQ
jgi:hypothetical protein